MRRRIRPLLIAAALQGVALWAPVEKLFLEDIGFTASTIGLLGASYAAVVPFLEIPSGILADRWSRRGVLVLADVALVISTVLGGVAQNVGVYLVAALFLGAFLALHSGTSDSMIYDVLIEEAGSSDGFERHLGRLRLFESTTLFASALAGGLLASATSPRMTYFATLPFIGLSVVALLRFDEPRLHRTEDAPALRSQVKMTYGTIVGDRRLRPVIATMVVCAMLLQVLIEFGALWLVAFAAPAALFGPQWAGLMAANGFGGLVGGRLSLDNPVAVMTGSGVLVASSVTLVWAPNAATAVVAEIALTLVLVAISTLLTARLHDGIPSSIRAGVSSGVGTLTSAVFLPFALTFGAIADHVGVTNAAWMVVAAAAAAAMLLVRTAADPCVRHAPDCGATTVISVVPVLAAS